MKGHRIFQIPNNPTPDQIDRQMSMFKVSVWGTQLGRYDWILQSLAGMAGISIYEASIAIAAIQWIKCSACQEAECSGV
jgi:hypothetical protein